MTHIFNSRASSFPGICGFDLFWLLNKGFLLNVANYFLVPIPSRRAQANEIEKIGIGAFATTQLRSADAAARY